ncbi:hypothetical protein ABQF35_25495 [Mycobacterium syngnathidarum]
MSAFSRDREFERCATDPLGGHTTTAGGRPRRVADRSVTFQDVCPAALTIIDSEGIAALNTRRLATEVGISTRALYKRIINRHTLIREVVRIYVTSLNRPVSEHSAWDVALVDWYAALYRALLEHPHLTALVTKDDVSDACLPGLIAFVVGAGVPEKQARKVCRLMLNVTVSDAITSKAEPIDRGTPSQDLRSVLESMLAAPRAAFTEARVRHLPPENARASGGGAFMTQVEQRALAWSLAEIAAPYLSRATASSLYAEIAVGDVPAAIVSLLDCCHRHVELPDRLIDMVRNWIRGYAGTEFAAALRPYVH